MSIMKTLIVILCFFTSIASAQKETEVVIKDNLFKASLFHNISLSNNLSLQNGLSVRKNIDYDTFEIPILIKYDLTSRWSAFFGFQSRTVIYSHFPDSFNIEKPSPFYLSFGTEYEFKNNTTGSVVIGFPFDLHLGLKF